MFQEHPVNRPNQTGHKIMRYIGILIQRGRRSIIHPTKGLMSFGEDWTLILDSYLFL